MIISSCDMHAETKILPVPINLKLTMQSPPGIYTHTAQWPIFSLAWSVRGDKRSRLAIGSSLEDYSNKVELVQFSPDTSDFTTDTRMIFDHPYAPTNLIFFPSEDSANPDIVAASGDYLRLWQIHEDRIELKSLLNGNKNSEFDSSITSFDWAEFDVQRVATSSIDTTCTIWDIGSEKLETQLVAHDKEVYDISWGGFNIFASVSGDGSLRVFDLRDKERSTIIYENPVQGCPLLRLEWNKRDPRFIATVGSDSDKVVILDIRVPTTPVMELSKHKGCVNAMSWSPCTGQHMCTVGDDSRALIWQVAGTNYQSETGVQLEPEMWYGNMAEINNVRWSPVDFDWIAIVFLNKLQLLKV